MVGEVDRERVGDTDDDGIGLLVRVCDGDVDAESDEVKEREALTEDDEVTLSDIVPLAYTEGDAVTLDVANADVEEVNDNEVVEEKLGVDV